MLGGGGAVSSHVGGVLSGASFIGGEPQYHFSNTPGLCLRDLG